MSAASVVRLVPANLKMVQAVGIAPTRIFRLRAGCPSKVASLAFRNLVLPAGLSPTQRSNQERGLIYRTEGLKNCRDYLVTLKSFHD
jgi:hypothetical protein